MSETFTIALAVQVLFPIAVFAALVVLLGYFGKWLNEVLPWREAAWWRATLPVHAPIAGLLLGGLPGMPPPPVEGVGTAGTMLFYCAAGVFAVLLYDRIRKKLEGE